MHNAYKRPAFAVLYLTASLKNSWPCSCQDERVLSFGRYELPTHVLGSVVYLNLSMIRTCVWVSTAVGVLALPSAKYQRVINAYGLRALSWSWSNTNGNTFIITCMQLLGTQHAPECAQIWHWLLIVRSTYHDICSRLTEFFNSPFETFDDR